MGDTAALEQKELANVAELFGGADVLRRSPRNPIEAHDLLVKGLPAKALIHLVDSLVILNWDAALENILGMSLRTLQRHKEVPKKALSREQSGRAWKFAEILAKATAVFGSQHEAEQWLERPAMALEQRRPIDLLATPAGAELVDALLGRLEYGVYV